MYLLRILLSLLALLCAPLRFFASICRAFADAGRKGPPLRLGLLTVRVTGHLFNANLAQFTR